MSATREAEDARARTEEAGRRPRTEPAPAPPAAAQVLALQRGAGNAAVTAMLARREDSGGLMGDLWAGVQEAGAAAAGALGALLELKIAASVGRGGKNHPPDVAQIHARLQALGFASAPDPDAIAEAIERYQAEVVGLRRPDGRVDPGGRTVGALAAMKRAPAGDADAAPAGPAPMGPAGPAPAGPGPMGPAGPAPAGPGPMGPAGPGPMGPAGPAPAGPAAPAGPRGTLADPALDALVATAAKPEVDAAAAKLASLEKKFRGLAKSSTNEEKGTGRDELVEGFGDLRELIARIDGAGLDPKQAAALKAQFFRAMNAITPFYFQGNNIILEFDRINKNTQKLEHVWNTCNITSLSMVLEALGKSAADYKYKSLIPAIAKVYTKDVDDRAKDKVADDEGTYLSGLRLPDYVAMAAIVWQMGYKTGTKEQILAGGNAAFNAVPSSTAIIRLAKDFGATANPGAFKLDASAKKDPGADRLRSYGEKHHGAADKQAQAETELHEIEAKLASESNAAKKASLEKQKAKLEAKVAKGPSLTDAGIEAKIPLEQYKRTILTEVGAELDRGNEIVVGQFNHFVRLQSVDEEFVVKDDPGGFTRGNMRATWEEARAMGLFTKWISIS